ncbi:MAG TPA: AsmA-like C-terminal region-containing protein [Mesorhizobium sp.]|nr:AsmA-like C-terminal region-containing protein [Mesorhizobium sp.]
MTEETLRHERIKWRRADIADLGALPSAEGQDLHPRPQSGSRPRRRATRLAAAGLTATVALSLLLAGLVYAAGVSGFGREQLRREAERALERMMGQDVVALLGGAHLSLDGSRLLGLTVSDVRLGAAGAKANWIDAGAVHFGIELLPLLGGDLALGSATIENARIALPPPNLARQGDWTLALRNKDGLFHPQKLPPAAFEGLNRLFAALTADAPGTLSLANVALELPAGEGAGRVLTIEDAEVASDGLTLDISASGTFAERSWALEGTASRPDKRAPVQALELRLASSALAGPDDAAGSRIGELTVKITGAAEAGRPERLALDLQMGSTTLDLGKRGLLEGEVGLAVQLKADSDEAKVDRLALRVGNSTMRFSGALAPRRAEAATMPAYGYELTLDQASIAPTDSPEAPVALEGRVVGTFDPQALRLAARDVSLAAGQGRIAGSAALTVEQGHTPGVEVALDVAGLSVAEAKQLWPWFTARQAREWALEHVSAGTVESGRVRFDVLPGRLGSGVPTTPDESWGEFTISNASFKPLRTLPEVQGADGVISYRAFDADISVTKAGMTTPGGFRLGAKDAKLTLRDTNHPPVVGKLDLTVSGSAQGAAELIALEPIGAGDKLPFKPEELSGQVEAQVLSDFPLEKGFPRDSLDWEVALGFEDLALSKALDGQMLTNAEGTAAIRPDGASIDAEAQLNDTPAELRVVEPFRPDGPARERKITLALDDKTRDRLAPGLSSIVSGPIALVVDAADPIRTVEADLSQARLDLPWVGWSKGSGIPAKAVFKLEGEGGDATISDLSIEGPSFRASGSATVRGGALSSAKFGRVRLNRGDDIAVDVRRGEGGGYAITVSGEALDARSLLKRITGEEPKAKKSVRKSNGPAVTVTASLGQAVGFEGESLRDVKLSYKSGNAGRGSLTLDALTASGAPVSISDGGKGETRTIEMQSGDAGALLRFLNIYPKMQGGRIEAALTSTGGGPLSGRINARDFAVIDEERLGSVVSRRAPGSARSLSEAVEREIDTSRVRFDRGSAEIAKGEGFLRIRNGVLRGPTIGATFQGTLFDAQGRMDMTGTFMPAYGLNRLFGELPLVGVILGNGRDRGLIGVTFKLEGEARKPTLTVNPLSVIAPGIFRSIFEYDTGEERSSPRPVTSVR